jgi:uncharacterized membrane protein YfcA
MSFIIIGLLVGVSLALTGSGGALLAIPLFITFLGFSLKVGTFYSLIVVAIASIIGVVANLKIVQYRYALLMSLGSLIGSFIFKDIKQHISDQLIIILLYIVCLYSMFLIWSKNKRELSDTAPQASTWVLILVGLLLGILTTLTGLGGGVLLLPLFIKGFHLEEHKAVATSLMTIFFSSAISFLMQLSTMAQTPSVIEMLLMVVGVSLAVFPVKFLIKRLHEDKIFFIRRTVYSTIVIYTLVSLAIRG